MLQAVQVATLTVSVTILAVAVMKALAPGSKSKGKPVRIVPN